jgi:endoglucanase
MRATDRRIRALAGATVAMFLAAGSGLPQGSGADARIAGAQSKRVFHSGGVINRASGKGLDVQDRSREDGANIQQWDFTGAPNQTWDVIEHDEGVYSIVNRGSGKALDVTDRSTEDGANVQQFRFDNGKNQLWRLRRATGDFYQIVSVSNGRCLDVDNDRIKENGANVQQWRCASVPNQQWRLTK